MGIKNIRIKFLYNKDWRFIMEILLRIKSLFDRIDNNDTKKEREGFLH